MKPGRLLILLALMCVPAVVAAPQEGASAPAPMDKKQLEAKAKGLVEEGKSLEKQADLDGARDKYIEAEGYISTKDALDGIKHVRDAKEKKAEALLEDARNDCNRGAIPVCVTKLQQALDAGPEKDAALHNDLALYHQKLGEREQALAHLGSLIASTHDTKERISLAELRTSLLTGQKAPVVSGDSKKRIEGFNGAYVQTSGEPADEAAQTGGAATVSLCDRIKELQTGGTTDAATTFDAAKCAEEDGDDARAAVLLAQYLQLAPDALDARDVRLHRDSVLTLASLDGDIGEQVRSHFATAASDLDYRRYDRAIGEYQAAQVLAPNFALTYWRLGLLWEASGDVAQSRAYLQRYIPMEADAERKADAQSHLDSLDEWRSTYDDDIDDAHDVLADLLLRSLGLQSEGVKHKVKLKKNQKKLSQRSQRMFAASESLSEPFVRQQMDIARNDLEEARELFPIAPEANELLALLDLEENDWPSAFRDLDAVASAGLPVSFYVQLNSSRDSKIVRATKVEIGQDSVRLVYLDSYNARKKMAEAPDRPAGDDDLGNLVVSATLRPDAGAESISLAAADLQQVQTEKNFVILKRQKEQFMLAPVYMVAFTPTEGRTAREFGNEYTRMFVRYLGYEKARLGKEGMTFGEKLKLGYSFAETGMSFFQAVGSGGLGSYGAFSNTMKLAHTLRTDVTNLRRQLQDQARTLQGLEFKAIPAEQVELTFRDHL